MTVGVLIFAFNNEQIDYLAMAAWSARNIHRHLNLPVCVVTDSETIPSNYEFDQVIKTQHRPPAIRNFTDIEGSVKWYNANRIDAYELSPWDRTLVLDADYVVASNQLLTITNTKQDFLCHRSAYDISGQQPFTDTNTFGRFNMPMWWATVMMFNRSRSADLIFKSMIMIHDNWQHYRNIYRTHKSTYRNDHALTIALGMVNGHILEHDAIPWDLATLTAGPTLTQVSQDHYKIDYFTINKKHHWINIVGQDFHAMGKTQLGAVVANSC